MRSFNPEIAAQAMIPKELLDQSSSLHFSLHLRKNGFEASISEAAGGELHWSSHVREESEASGNYTEHLNFRNWHEKIFRRCTVSYDTEIFTLIPSGFFESEKASEILSFSSGKICRRTNYIELPEWEAVLVWEEPEDVVDVLKYFPNARMLPTAFLILKYCSIVLDRKEDTIAIMRSGSLLNLFVFKQGQPIMLNAHQTNGDEDVLYYASHAAMTLGIDFENCQLHIYDQDQDITLLNLLGHYNRNLTSIFSENTSSIRTGIISQLHILCA